MYITYNITTNVLCSHCPFADSNSNQPSYEYPIYLGISLPLYY